MQRKDFAAIFRIMAGLPVTIRLLDPPLHEFLPTRKKTFAGWPNRPASSARCAQAARAEELHEFNPMLGHRGCRLGVTYPEIYEMQARAIFEAALDVAGNGKAPIPEVMIPLVATRRELELMKALVDKAAERCSTSKAQVEYLVGTMIELPRAALRAGRDRGRAEFFSFGTNDLTQTAFGISRDDASRFLKIMSRRASTRKIPSSRSTATASANSSASAARAAARRVRAIKLGVCGEHGGDPASIFFCEYRNRPRLCQRLPPYFTRADRRWTGNATRRRRQLAAGWLVKNEAHRWSVGGNAPVRDANGNWAFTVSPQSVDGVWLPTGRAPQFDLTLRTYHPNGALLNDPAKAKLPTIKKGACA
jgi:hypothetical protein